jgi:transmembrane sensor
VSSRWNTPPSLLAAGLAALVLGLGALLLWANGQNGLYATGIGEQRIVNLSDGSTIELNAESRVLVGLGDAERVVDLLEGQALFHVAKDLQRPFIVRSDTTRVRAVGTQFDVNRQATDTVVTVLEGRVAVARALEGGTDARHYARAPSEASPLYASAGEQVILTAQAVSKPAHPDVAAATAWRERKLVFSSSPLPQVVGEYNRYHEKRLVIADPTLSDFRISGVFSAADAASLIAFLKVQSNIEVDERPNEIVLRAK